MFLIIVKYMKRSFWKEVGGKSSSQRAQTGSKGHGKADRLGWSPRSLGNAQEILTRRVFGLN
jgi:hypothetical protein